MRRSEGPLKSKVVLLKRKPGFGIIFCVTSDGGKNSCLGKFYVKFLPLCLIKVGRHALKLSLDCEISLKFLLLLS